MNLVISFSILLSFLAVTALVMYNKKLIDAQKMKCRKQ
jgi:hypothetical protein